MTGARLGTPPDASAWGRGSVRRLAVVVVLATALAVGGAGLWAAATGNGDAGRSEQAEALAAELRCPTCQNTSVADSPSETARAMRRTIDEQLADGRSPEQVRQWFVDRYGSWVLLDPPADGPGLALWVLPAAGILGGGTVALRATRRRTGAGPPADPDGSPVDDPSPDPWELEAVLDGILDGRVSPGESLAGERLVGAAVLLADVRADDPAARTPARAAAEAEAAAAFLAWRPGPVASAGNAATRPVAARGDGGAPTAAGDVVTGPASATVPVPPRRPRRRRLAWTALVVAFATALTVVLLPSLRARTAGDLITGDPLDQPRSAEQQAAGTPPADTPSEDLPSIDDVTALQREVRDDPGNAGWRIALGDALDLQGRADEALEQYRAARELRPDDPAAAIRVAFMLGRAGDVAGARSLLQEILAGSPDEPDALFLLGTLELRAGEAGGQARLQRFLEVAPDHPAGQQVRDTLGLPDPTEPP